MELNTQDEQAALVEATDRGFARHLGHELRLAREANGWARAELVKRLPSGIGDRTLLSYEHGTRQMTVVRLIEICGVLGIPASVIVYRAMVRAGDLRGYSFTVNLEEILRDQQSGFEQVRVWAATRLRETSHPELLLSAATVREMSAVLGMAHRRLAMYLDEFTNGATTDGEWETITRLGSASVLVGP